MERPRKQGRANEGRGRRHPPTAPTCVCVCVTFLNCRNSTIIGCHRINAPTLTVGCLPCLLACLLGLQRLGLVHRHASSGNNATRGVQCSTETTAVEAGCPADPIVNHHRLLGACTNNVAARRVGSRKRKGRVRGRRARGPGPAHAPSKPAREYELRGASQKAGGQGTEGRAAATRRPGEGSGGSGAARV